MPSKPKRPCSQSGCPELVSGASTCAAHSKQRDMQRGSVGQRGYDTRWKRRRKAYIYKHPWCVLCAKPATVADHHPLSRKQLLAQGIADPDTDDRLRPLCVRCHSIETAKHQPGGFAAEKRSMREARERPPF